MRLNSPHFLVSSGSRSWFTASFEPYRPGGLNALPSLLRIVASAISRPAVTTTIAVTLATVPIQAAAAFGWLAERLDAGESIGNEVTLRLQDRHSLQVGVVPTPVSPKAKRVLIFVEIKITYNLFRIIIIQYFACLCINSEVEALLIKSSVNSINKIHCIS